jgi:hypothetical protein
MRLASLWRLPAVRKNTYIYTILLGLDRFAAAILFNRADITISALCWVVRYAPTDPIAAIAYDKLKFNRWQVWFLIHCAAMLEWMSAGHCARARETDVDTAADTRDLLDVR